MTPISLDEMKKIELDILTAFDEFCRKNNLQYQLAYGTLIGAIRHKGFIPWDDDIDILMSRSDYEKFYELFTTSETAPYKVISYRDKSSIYPFFKVVNERTYVNEVMMNPKFSSGVWIDIFPLDGANSNNLEPFKKCRDLINKYALYAANPNRGTTKLRTLIKKITSPFINPDKCYELAQEIEEISKSQSIEDSDKVASYPDGFYEKGMLSKDALETIELEFEGHSFLGPKLYDYVLTTQYGDYMQLPPPSSAKAVTSSKHIGKTKKEPMSSQRHRLLNLNYIDA